MQSTTKKSANTELGELKETPNFNNICVDSDDEQEKAIRKGRKERKEKKERPPKNNVHKAVKRFVKDELQKQSKEMYTDLMTANDFKQTPHDPEANISSEDENGNPVHANIACDGCNVAPITGIRYKCTVLRNFNFCESCEERLTHEHPLIKIRNP